MSDPIRSAQEILLSEEKLRAEIAHLQASTLVKGKESQYADLQQAHKALEIAASERYMRAELAKADDARVLSFYGAVTSSSASAAIQKLSDWHRRDPGLPIEIIFNSPGGSVIDGLALFDYILDLRSRGTHITTITMGMAASMGGVLLQSGDHRIASKHSVLLIHEVSSGAGGKVSEIEDQLKFMELLQAKCLDILAERSTMSTRQIATKWKKTDWWLPADEALKLGFVDEVR